MGSLLDRIVTIQIQNNTKRFTLKNPRTYFDCGLCSKPPHPILSPGSRDLSHYEGDPPFWGVVGILVYEAESFSLAIHFCNPINYKLLPMALGLELSLSRAHSDLEATYTRMAESRPSSCPDTEFDHITLTKSHRNAEVSNGAIRVTASMSNTRHTVIKVVVEEQVGLEGEAGTETPCPGRHVQER